LGNYFTADFDYEPIFPYHPQVADGRSDNSCGDNCTLGGKTDECMEILNKHYLYHHSFLFPAILLLYCYFFTQILPSSFQEIVILCNEPFALILMATVIGTQFFN
jgi:hypothetical protein